MGGNSGATQPTDQSKAWGEIGKGLTSAGNEIGQPSPIPQYGGTDLPQYQYASSQPQGSGMIQTGPDFLDAMQRILSMFNMNGGQS